LIRENFKRETLLNGAVIGAVISVIAIVIGACIRDVVIVPEWVQTGGEMSDIILIDPGHGGFDGGAVASDGTVEKDINLAISLPLADILRVLGYNVDITRDSDAALDEQGITTIRGRKVSDMRNRLEQYNQSRMVISIHQNHFTQAQYYGTQVIYGGSTAESTILAESIRQTVGSLLEQPRLRELKKGSRDVFLLHNADVPVVLVECGFLSNSAERERLKNVEYQHQMAFSIACGIILHGIYN